MKSYNLLNKTQTDKEDYLVGLELLEVQLMKLH